ncbi:MAG TPA: hypothetical protein VK071_06005 [Tissierellales bacterium]|nr:hypothetical protein [Tissierellales bacterium]
MTEGFKFSNCNGKMEFDLDQIKELDCIMVDKVYDQCQQRECYPKVEIDIGSKSFDIIRFKQGFIMPDTLKISDIPNKPHFRRVQFTLRVPYEVILSDGTSVEGFLPDTKSDIVMFIPDTRDEFEFKIIVETNSQVLGQPMVIEKNLTFTAGLFIIIKVLGRVQLLIPTFGFCPEPPECEEFSPEDICEDFDCHPFPLFFPLQYQDIFEDED